MNADEIADRIEAFLALELGHEADVEIDGLTRVTTGRSRHNWPFEASWTTPQGRLREELIIRVDPDGA